MGYVGGIKNVGRSRGGAGPKRAGSPKTDSDNRPSTGDDGLAPPGDGEDGLGPLVQHRDVLGATSLAGEAADAGAGGPSVPQLTRKLSVMSQKTVETLEGLEQELESMKVPRLICPRRPFLTLPPPTGRVVD